MNMLPVVREGLRFVKESNLVVLKADKQPCFVLSSVSSAAEEALRILDTVNYEEVPWHWVCKDSRYQCHRDLAREIENHTKREGLANALCESLRVPKSDIVSALKMTCKSTKDPGNVGFRPLHGGAPNAFANLSKWISSILRRTNLSEQRYLLKDVRSYVGIFTRHKRCADDRLREFLQL
jgi:hypothetical protein